MNNNDKITAKDIAGLALIGAAAIIIIFALFGTFRTVKAGHVGIVTRFGKVVRTADSGLTLKWPFIEKVVKMDTRVQKEEMDASAASKDMQDVYAKIAVNYTISKETAVDIYNRLGKDYKDSIIIPATSESFKAGISQYTAEALITDRAEAKEQILAALKDRIAEYGITITDLNIIDLSFSDAFNQAIEAKAVAQQQVETAKQELERAKIEAEKTKTEAEAQAAAQRAQEDTLSDLLIKKMWIEKWDGQLPSTMTDDAGLMMNMSK